MMRSTYTVAELLMEDELIDMSGLAISPRPEPDDA